MKMRKKVYVGAVAVLLAVSASMTAMAATEHWQDASAKAGSNAWSAWVAAWPGISSNVEQIALTPGTDATQLNFSWYSHTNETPSVRVSTSSDMSGFSLFTGAENTQFTSSNKNTYYSNRVSATGLKPGTTYYYTYYTNGAWTTTPTKFQTPDSSSFSFLWAGDPQIGSSQNQTPTNPQAAEASLGTTQNLAIAARNDSYNWASTLTTALQAHPGFNFILSAGDNMESNNQASDSTGTYYMSEYQLAGFLSPSVLRSIPIASTIGNHDANQVDSKYHFNSPNTNTGEASPKAAGYDYYYSYNNALFIVLDTNNLNVADHVDTLNKATAAYPNTKWRILSFHQDIYGSGKDHSDSDGIVLRTQITPLVKQYKIDIVLNGHDHSYTRSYELIDNGETHTNYSATDKTSDGTSVSHADYLAGNNDYTILNKKNADGSYIDETTAIDPQGTFYFTADSSTGSKFYELLSPQQNYVAKRWQNWIPTYSIVNVNESSLTINTFEADTGSKIDDTFTIVKAADKASLNDLIQTAQATDTGKYTDDSVKALNDAIAAAQKVAGDATASSVDVSNAYGTLQKAISNLVLKSSPTPTDTGLNNTSTNVSTTTSTTASNTSSTASNPATGVNNSMYGEFALLALIGAGVVVITNKIKRKLK